MSKLLINKANVRRYVLDYAAQIGRKAQVQRVGGKVYVDLDERVKHFIRAMVQSHPSAFKTLEP